MIDAQPSLHAAASVSAGMLVDYLRLRGWTAQASPIGGVTILSKVVPDAAGPVHIVLPEIPGVDDQLRRVADALRTIEIVEERPISSIVEDVSRLAGENKRDPGPAKPMERRAHSPRARLASYSITELSSIEAGAIEPLKAAGIRTTCRLLEVTRTPHGRKMLAEKTGLNPKTLLRLASFADRMRIKSIGQDYAELLEAAGVETVRELRLRNAASLAKLMLEANAQLKLVRLLPSKKVIEGWIEQAKRLPIMLKH